MLYVIVAFLVLILDQAVKYWTTVSIALDTGSATLIPGVIGLVNIHNYGAAFGLLQNARWFFVVIAILFVGVVVFALWKNIIRDPLGRWSAVLVMSGAIGNCIDRVMNGYVVDMFQFEFKIFGRDFAVFNVADIFITVCGVLFCVYIIFSDEFRKKPAGNTKAPEKRSGFKMKLPRVGKKDKTTPAPEKRDVDGVRTYSPKAPRSSTVKATVVKADTDPFAEWASLPHLDPASAHSRDTVVSSSVTSVDAISKAPPEKKSSAPETEFSLEDILAEYSSK